MSVSDPHRDAIRKRMIAETERALGAGRNRNRPMAAHHTPKAPLLKRRSVWLTIALGVIIVGAIS
jgi:hypothetical protein